MKKILYIVILYSIPSVLHAQSSRQRCYLKYISNTNEEMIATVVAKSNSELLDGDRLIIECNNKRKCHIKKYIKDTPFNSCTKILSQGGYLFIIGDDGSRLSGIGVYKIINGKVKIILEDASFGGFRIYSKEGRMHVISYRETRVFMKYRPVDYTLGNVTIKSAD